MKKRSFILILLAAVFIIVSVSVTAQVYGQIRPPVPVIVRPPQPAPVYVWVNEEWEQEAGAYRYSGGHWAPPPQPGHWYKKQASKNGKHKGNYKARHKGKHKGKH